MQVKAKMAPVQGALAVVQVPVELVRGATSSETLSSHFFLVLFRHEARRNLEVKVPTRA